MTENIQSDPQVITDAELDAWAVGGHEGERKSVAYFRPLTPEQRRLAYREASTRMNTSPGWNFSGAAWQACKDVAEGRTPSLDFAKAMRDADQNRLA